MNRYQFSIWEFSDEEIEQIVALVDEWAKGGSLRPVDRRKLKISKEVEHYAIRYGLLEWHCRHGVISNDRLPWGCEKCNPKRPICHYWRLHWPSHLSRVRFDPCWDLPPEALWQIVKDIIGDKTGFSIARDGGWHRLGIWSQNSQWATEKDLQAKLDVLISLAKWGYLIFNSAGSIWSVTILES